MYTRRSIEKLAAAILIATSATASAQSRTIDFNRDVRPILSDNCFFCHGPDKQRKGLRLDVPDIPLEKKAIVPGQPAESELIRRITSDDPEERMPLAESNRSLTQEQIATLTQWIAEGAVYETHWAFQPVRMPAPPAADAHPDWIRQPIDAFVAERLQAEGLEPRPQAGKARLLRRVTMDLTGLPPTRDEVDAFLGDDASDAYERAVDRLLASPRYGEHMAVGWLDLARYADTHGYQNDRPSNMWPWRDWVIRAYNDDLPYDDFITWQLAGDLLPNPTQDQVLATGFNRLHRQTNEGGSVNEEFLVEYASDRTNTFGMAFLGLTMECARCHDHKFDPISQKDYYSLFAFFSNIDESGMYSHFTDATPSPSMFLYEPGQADEHLRLKDAVTSAEARVATERAAAVQRFNNWTRTPAADLTPIVSLSFETIEEGKTPNAATPDTPAKVGSDIDSVSGPRGNAIHFSGENSVTLDKVGDFERTDPFTIAAWVNPGADGKDWMVLWHHSMASLDAASRGYEMFLDEGRLVASLVYFWPGNAIRVRSTDTIPVGEWTHIAMTYDGSSRAVGLTLYINGAPAVSDIVRDNLYSTIKYAGGPPPLTLGARFRDPGFKDGSLDEFRVYDHCLTPNEVHALATGEPAAPDADYYTQRIDTNYIESRTALHEARRAESDFVNALRQVMVMREKSPDPRAHVYARGAYDAPRDEVQPDTPASVLAYPADSPRNRLGLAQWLTNPDHPLTSRVEVNRLWKHFFGRGLVSTPEDFGSQGALPSHPQLLDYLAATFMQSGWDIKALCRTIVTSATYMQDSTGDADLLERDPENILLARGPRMRLTAEQTRDAALLASELMTPDIGGPSVKPYQPDGLWEEATSVPFTRDSGDKLYRRSLYTFIKRTVPPPMMVTFDATNRETCIARREVTQTPLQALVLMNDPQFVEAARVLAEVVLGDNNGKTKPALDEAFVRLTGRYPSSAERKLLRKAYEEQRGFFAADDGDPVAYVGEGESPAPENLDAADLAAMTAVVQLLMNFDEFQVTL